MTKFSTLAIPSVKEPPFKLKDIIYNCPTCDFEIDINLTVDDSSFIKCNNCSHTIKLKFKKI